MLIKVLKHSQDVTVVFTHLDNLMAESKKEILEEY